MSGQPSYLGVVTAGWVAALKSRDSLERRLAAHALAEIGRMAREAVPPLTEALRDTESFVRVWAAAALARVEPEHPDVIPALVAGTRDGISYVRSLAAWHLGRLGPRHPGIEVAVPDLRELLNDNDPSVCAEATVALESLAGKGAPPAELKSLSELDEFSIFAHPPPGGLAHVRADDLEAFPSGAGPRRKRDHLFA